VGNVGLE
jgi:hypothetical protein